MKQDETQEVECAQRERILFVERIGSIFLGRIFDQEDALVVTDESRLWDFANWGSYDIESALRPGSSAGHFVFKKKKSFTRAEFAAYRSARREGLTLPFEEIEAEPTYFRRDVVRKTQDVFGVDISSVFDRELPEVFLFVASHMPLTKRVMLGL